MRASRSFASPACVSTVKALRRSVGIDLAANEAVALESRHRGASCRQELERRLLSERGHPEASLGRVERRDQHVEFCDRDAVLASQCPVDSLSKTRRDLRREAPSWPNTVKPNENRSCASRHCQVRHPRSTTS